MNVMIIGGTGLLGAISAEELNLWWPLRRTRTSSTSTTGHRAAFPA